MQQPPREAADDVLTIYENAAVERKVPHTNLAFGTYIAHDLEHMHEEETVAAPQLWSLFTDAELMVIENRIVGSLPLERAMAFMRLMIPAANRGACRDAGWHEAAGATRGL
jgi:hypothetical protein